MEKLFRSIFLLLICLVTHNNVQAQLKIGDTIKSFNYLDRNGLSKTFEPAEYDLVLIDFWASWCGPCRLYFDTFKDWQTRFGTKGLNILALSLDDDVNDWKNCIDKYQLNYEHALLQNGFANKACLYFDVHSIPKKYLLYKGVVVSDASFSVAQIEEKIKILLNK